MWILRCISLVSLAFSVSAGTYQDYFQYDQNPTSENSHWIQGKDVGLDWNNTMTTNTAGHRLNVGLQTGSGFDDAVALVKASAAGAVSWGGTQYCSGHIFFQNPQAGSYEEVEFRVLSTVTAHNNTGYECNWSMRQDGGAYAQIVRWNGALGDFTLLDSRAIANLPQGCKLSCIVSNGTIYTYTNDVLLASFADSTYTSGSPGVGYYFNNSGGGGYTNWDYGFTNFLCTDFLHSVSNFSASTAFLDYQAALNVTTNPGDFMYLPPGTGAISAVLNVSNAVSIIGSGTNNCVLNFAADGPIFNFYNTSIINTNMTLANIQLAQGVAPSSSAWFYVYGCNTNNSYMIVSNCFFNWTTSPCPFVIGGLGVMYGCTWNLASGIGCYVYHENWNNHLYSSGSFADPVAYGGSNFWYIEKSVMNRTNSSYAFTDAYRGARYVVRHCTLTNCWLELHGTESGFVRGTRAIESYGNLFYGDGVTDYAHNFRSGTGILWSNTFLNGAGAANFAHLDAYRSVVDTAPWGQATGDNPVDNNGGVNNAGVVLDSGTASAGGETNLTDNTKTWTVNQWYGCSLARMSPLSANTTLLTDYRSGYIVSNSATHICVKESIGGAFPNIVFAAGDTYRIYTNTQIFDQPGAGADTAEQTWFKPTALSVAANVASATLASHGLSTGDYTIIGDLFINPDFIYTLAQVTVDSSSAYHYTLYHANGSAQANFEGWTTKVHIPYAQTLDPCYEWNNYKEGGVAVTFSSGKTNIIRLNEHYYNGTPKPGYHSLPYPHPLISNSGVSEWPPASGQITGGSTFTGGKITGPAKLGAL